MILFSLPVLGSKPNANKSVVVITVINIKGTKTINQEIIPKPWSQSILSMIVKSIITMNFKNAVL